MARGRVQTTCRGSIVARINILSRITAIYRQRGSAGYVACQLDLPASRLAAGYQEPQAASAQSVKPSCFVVVERSFRSQVRELSARETAAALTRGRDTR